LVTIYLPEPKLVHFLAKCLLHRLVVRAHGRSRQPGFSLLMDRFPRPRCDEAVYGIRQIIFVYSVRVAVMTKYACRRAAIFAEIKRGFLVIWNGHWAGSLLYGNLEASPDSLLAQQDQRIDL
jgi:hypothetical protein